MFWKAQNIKEAVKRRQSGAGLQQQAKTHWPLQAMYYCIVLSSYTYSTLLAQNSIETEMALTERWKEICTREKLTNIQDVKPEQ